MNHTVPSSYRRSASSTYPKRSTISQRIKRYLVSVVGSTTSKESTTFSAKRMYPRHPPLCVLSLTFYRVSTLRAAIELKSVFDQIQAAEKAGNLSPEEKKRLEEQAAEKGLQALFKVSRSLEINVIILKWCMLGHETRSRVDPS